MLSLLSIMLIKRSLRIEQIKRIASHLKFL